MYADPVCMVVAQVITCGSVFPGSLVLVWMSGGLRVGLDCMDARELWASVNLAPGPWVLARASAGLIIGMDGSAGAQVRMILD